jgi:hypothetical protein
MEIVETKSGLLIPKEKEPPKQFDWDAYYKQHAECPRCANNRENMIVTTAGTPYGYDWNNAQCTVCNWRGQVDDLVPEGSWHEATHLPAIDDIQVWIRTSLGEVYSCVYRDSGGVPDWYCAQKGIDGESWDTGHFCDVQHWAYMLPKEWP